MTTTSQLPMPTIESAEPSAIRRPLTGDRWGQDGVFTQEELARLSPSELIAYACGTQIVRLVVPEELTYCYDTIDGDQLTD